MLAESRDAHVAIDAAAALEKEFGAGSNARAFSDLTSFLIARRDRAGEKFDGGALEAVLSELKKAKASLKKLDLRHAKMSDLLDSACATYRQSRRAMKAALLSCEDEAVHDWRKLTQRHWRHILLLKEWWPKEAKARIAQARRLSDLLGQHNDLAVVRKTILENWIVFRRPSDVKMLCRCIETKQQELLKEAASRGGRLYAEKPKALAWRLSAYWESARHWNGSAEAPPRAPGLKTPSPRPSPRGERGKELRPSPRRESGSQASPLRPGRRTEPAPSSNGGGGTL